MIQQAQKTLRLIDERLKYRVVIPGLIYGLILASIALVDVISRVQM